MPKRKTTTRPADPAKTTFQFGGPIASKYPNIGQRQFDEIGLRLRTTAATELMTELESISRPRSKVACINGEYEPDVIPQKELEEVQDMQKAGWSITKPAAVRAEWIRLRIEQGATVATGPLRFDAKEERVL